LLVATVHVRPSFRSFPDGYPLLHKANGKFKLTRRFFTFLGAILSIVLGGGACVMVAVLIWQFWLT